MTYVGMRLAAGDVLVSVLRELRHAVGMERHGPVKFDVDFRLGYKW